LYDSDNYVVLDFEVTNNDFGNPLHSENRIVLSGWLLGPDHPHRRDSGTYSRIETQSADSTKELFEDLSRATFVIAHNAKFELGWLKRIGFGIRQILVWDTQIAEYVWLGNTKKPLDLDGVAKRYRLGGKFSVIKALMNSGVCPSEMPSHWLVSYLDRDLEVTHNVFKKQRELLKNDKLTSTLFTRCLLTNCLVELEERGINPSPDRVRQVYRRFANDSEGLWRSWNTLTGGINPRSSKQKAEFFYGDLGFEVPKDYKGKPLSSKGGKPTTQIKDLLNLKAKNKKQRDVLDLISKLVKVNSALDKNLKGLLKCVENGDILRFKFNQTVTSTHRLSSSGAEYKMQGQNLPREFKPLFCSRNEGWYVGEIDQAQLEYRVAVFLGHDKKGLESIVSRVDRHEVTAHKIFGVSPEDENFKEFRTRAKAHTFKPLYGGSSGSPAERRYYNSFRQEHRGITETQQGWINEVLKNGFLTTITGLRFRFPGTRITESGYILNSSSICNYPIQSLATAEIVPISVVYIWHLMEAANMQSFLVNTVHDSVVAEVSPDERELFSELGVLSFTKIVYWYLKKVYGIEFDVPLEAEIKIEKFWGDSEGWRQAYLQ
jgi:DNA polymerase I-like protein with 3'-5' exonuclease and polymerase domains